MTMGWRHGVILIKSSPSENENQPFQSLIKNFKNSILGLSFGLIFKIVETR